MIITKTVKVKINNNRKYFVDKGYNLDNLSMKNEIEIKIEDLKLKSSCIVEIKCDYCMKVYETKYLYITEGRKTIQKDSCNECKNLKAKDVMLEKYNVTNPMQLEDSLDKIKKNSLQSSIIRDKIKKTCLKKYGHTSYPSSELGIKHIKSNMLKKYGVEHQMYLDSTKDKIKKTCLTRYGETNPMKTDEVKSKIKKTCLKRYGETSAMKNKTIATKCRNTLYENGSVATSKNQKHLCNLFNGILNYPLDWYNLDIFLKEHNIVCEYTGGGHDLSVKFGTVNQCEFNKKEIIRSKHIQKNGYKLITIICKNDKLLNDNEMIILKNYAIEYLIKNKNRHWVEIDLDNREFKTSQVKIELKKILKQ